MKTARRILLADDDPNDVELTLRALARNNIADAVQVVSNGQGALDYLQMRGEYVDRSPELPAVVFLDIKMPGMGGMEVLRRIRQDPALCLIPVVILTSSREEGDVRESYELGVNAYVVKPLGLADFMNAVEGLGAFWATVNLPPPHHRREVSGRRG